MKPSAVVFLAVSIGCAFMLACGAGSDIPRIPIVSVTSTGNPLVAQVLVRTECAGQAMVEFGPDTSYGRSTAWYALPGSLGTTSILVAGMKASTTYHLRAQAQCGDTTLNSGDLTFTTGALPSTIPFPALQVSRPNPSSSSESAGIELIDTTVPNINLMQGFFTDRDGNPIWYYDVGQGNYPFPFKLLPNGHFVFNIVPPSPGVAILREVDLAGNSIREMNANQLAQKMQSAGFDFTPTFYHHDMLPLDNGHLIVLMNFSKSFTNLPGYPGTIEVIGDGLVDLDPNWNPVWAWNSFDYLDVNRHLNGLPDWTHSNAVIYSPSDGNLLLSMRHQSWVLKIDYENGGGSGNVLWRLGYQGDFALMQGDDPSLWFSFQHFPSLINQNGSQTTLAVWDNGDNRVLDTSGTICGTSSTPACYSRATIFQIDESGMVADLLWADAPGYFSEWGGSVVQLSNGNVEFDINSPLIPPGPNVASEVQEVTQTGTPQTVWKMDIPLPSYAYRAYRFPSLYPGVTWQY